MLGNLSPLTDDVGHTVTSRLRYSRGMDFRVPERQRDARRWARVALAAVALGTVGRGILGLWFHPPFNYLYSDAAGYYARAVKLVTGAKLNRFDTFYPPGTHILIALPLKLFGTGRAGAWATAVLWFVLSSAVPFLAWRFSLRVMSARAAAVTAILVAAWPLFVTFGAFFMSDIPSLFFLLLTLVLAFKVREAAGWQRVVLGVAAGVAAGITIAMRPQVVVNVVLAIGTMLAARRSARVAVAVALGLALPLVPVLALNAHAAGKFVGLGEAGGMNFFQGHCPVRGITTEEAGVGLLTFASPVVVQQNRGRDYVFMGHMAWDQGFMIRQGLDCIKKDGIKHVEVLARNIADMGATSVPWPPSNEQPMRWFVKPANIIYSWSISAVVVFAFAYAFDRRRAERRAAGYAGQARGTSGTYAFGGTMLVIAHLLCLLPFAIVFDGDPRYRMPYDVFGLGLVAILVTEYARWPFHPRRRKDEAEARQETPASGA